MFIINKALSVHVVRLKHPPPVKPSRAMILLFRQIAVLVRKDLLLLFNPKSFTGTLWRAFIIPITFACYMSFILKVYWPKESYGVGSPNKVPALADAMNLATGGRNTLVLVNSISSGGDIDHAMQLIAQSVQSSVRAVVILNDESSLVETCRSTLQGTTKCYGAVIFNSSPKEGPGGRWNYTLRGDAAFGTNINVGQSTNDVEIYLIPLQRAVDAAIATVNSTGDAVPLPSHIDEYRMYSTFSWTVSSYSNVVQPSHQRRSRNGWTISSKTFRT
jgi:ATP-binding cassette, subfamily A (ABC1), member 3